MFPQWTDSEWCITDVVEVGDNLAVAHANGDIFLVSKQGEVLVQCQYPAEVRQQRVEKLVADPNGTRFASATESDVFCWNEEGTFIRQLALPDQPTDIAYAETGPLICLCGNQLLHFDEEGACIQTITLPITRRVAFGKILSSHTTIGFTADVAQLVRVIGDEDGFKQRVRCERGRVIKEILPLTSTGKAVVTFSNVSSFHVWDHAAASPRLVVLGGVGGPSVKTFNPSCRQWFSRVSPNGCLFSFSTEVNREGLTCKRFYQWNLTDGTQLRIGEIPDPPESLVGRMTVCADALIYVTRPYVDAPTFVVHQLPIAEPACAVRARVLDNMETHARMPAPYRAAVVALLSLTLGNPPGRMTHENWFRIPPELTFLTLEFFASTFRRSFDTVPTRLRFALAGAAPLDAPGGAAGADDDKDTPKICHP